LRYAAAGESAEEDVSSVEEGLATDPGIAELKAEMKRLNNSVQRLASLIKSKEPIREPKEITKEELEEHQSKRE
jgi:anti-sigma factor RsiW